VRVHKVRVYEVYAREVRPYEGFCEDLVRQVAAAQLSQLQLRFRRRHIWVPATAGVP
jgi:hypothetical protein